MNCMKATKKSHPKTSIQDSHITHPWRLINSGVNIAGLCKNSRCPACNRMVVINLGFDEFDCARIIHERKNKCPQCKNEIRPNKYVFYKCQWRYVEHYSTRDFPLNTVDDTYELNDLLAEYRIIETMPLSKSDRMHSKSQEITRPICLSNIENDDERIYLRCSNIFHRTRIYKWLQSNTSMVKKCPMCRDHVAV